MKAEKKNNDKDIQRTILKKNTFIKQNNKFNLNQNFEILPKLKIFRYYSTKLIDNFVPQIKPKKSFCKPTFFQLDENELQTKRNEKYNELENISSCDEEDESQGNSYISSSSEFESDEVEKEKENKICTIFEENENKSNKKNLYNKLYEEDYNSSIKNNDGFNKNENIIFKKNKDFFNNSNIKKDNNKHYSKKEFHLGLNSLDNKNNDGKSDKLTYDLNKKNINLSQKKFFSKSILEILSNKNVKKINL